MRRPASPLATAFAGMIGMAVAMGIGRFVFTPILPGMMEALSFPASAAGLIAAANYLGYLAGALAAAGGWLAGKERPVLLAAVLGTAPLTLAMGLLDGIPAFLLVRFLAGMVSAFAMIFLSGIVLARISEAGREELGAIHFGGVGLGISVSSILIASLTLSGGNWRGDWYWSALLALGGALLALGLLGSTRDATRPNVPEPPLPPDPRLRAIILSYGLFGFGYIVTTTFLVAIARDSGATRLEEAAVWLLCGLSGIPSVWLWQKVARRSGSEAAMALACLVEAAGVAASVLIPGMAGPYVGAVLVGGTFIAATSIGLGVSRRMALLSPRRVLALMTASFGLGQILGPLAAGWLADASGTYVSGSLLAAAALLASATLSFWAGRGVRSG